ncbi:hypothetical protein DPMN_024522 [Dreissena polymorpha]|uniref:Uncharacterized protein n=1 Tax=Dreissena polymorpha TaxID=45954 RepID=A0A9D4LPH3_DREPO|nr:hypothetical protein DPMN_024522 [Dreissena polymorpha]
MYDGCSRDSLIVGWSRGPSRAIELARSGLRAVSLGTHGYSLSLTESAGVPGLVPAVAPEGLVSVDNISVAAISVYRQGPQSR